MMALAADAAAPDVNAGSPGPWPLMMYALPLGVWSPPPRIAKSFLPSPLKSPIAATAAPTESLAAVPVNVALALAGERYAPVTVTSSTYHPSYALFDAFDVKPN